MAILMNKIANNLAQNIISLRKNRGLTQAMFGIPQKKWTLYGVGRLASL